MEIFYAEEDPFRAASIAYIGPSVTPYYNLNPGYRIYYVDGDHSTSTRVSPGFLYHLSVNVKNIPAPLLNYRQSLTWRHGSLTLVKLTKFGHLNLPGTSYIRLNQLMGFKR